MTFGSVKNICGGGSGDPGPIQMIMHMNHTGPNLTVILKNGCDQHAFDESIGWRNVKIIAANKSAIDYEGCWYVGTPAKLPTGRTSLPCTGLSYYDNGYISCQYCDTSCFNCSGPTNSDCGVC
jgi:hypothetical protein